ncbi:MAG TPA: hypothetical protein VMV46_13115 [Thermoanaerobaculia bacterium]|nr:hypothetical protein [Thermoanaerobaculia bacterium]
MGEREDGLERGRRDPPRDPERSTTEADDAALELAALRGLAAAAAHDLKNTLGLLRLQLDSAEDEPGGFGPEDLERARQGIVDGMASADRFAEMVRGLTSESAPVLLRHLLTDQQKRVEREHGGRVLVVTDYADRSLLARCRPGRTLGALRRMVDEAVASLGEGILVLRAESHDEGPRIVVGAVEMPVQATDMLDELDRWIERFRAGSHGEAEAGDAAVAGRLVYLERLRFPA